MDRSMVWNLTLPGGRRLALGRAPRVMAVLNLTPDSFSDGGLAHDTPRAVDRALEMLSEGAEILDLGAESTRPGGGVYGHGAATVGVREELDRLLPVLTRIRALTDVPISVDTRKAEVAKESLAAGADLINNVGGYDDDALHEVLAQTDVPLIVMHSRGELASMQQDIHYDEPLGEIRREIGDGVRKAVKAGITRDRIIVDPGIGFGKQLAHNLMLLRRLDTLEDLELPVMLGASRKSFIGQLTGDPPAERLPGSLAATAWAAYHGVAILRVHDVAATVHFLKVYQAIAEAGGGTTA